jgi:hypothetical protein
MNPQATGYRSIVRSIDGSVRSQVLGRVGFSLHPRELGQHTLYVAVKERTPIGLVHVRSEMSDWGLVEVAWALDLSLRVMDFRFQRCRGAACERAERDVLLRQALRGRGLDDLRAMLKAEGPSVIRSSVDPMMLDTLLRSAIKTIAVTEVGWSDELRRLRPAHGPLAADAEGP